MAVTYKIQVVANPGQVVLESATSPKQVTKILAVVMDSMDHAIVTTVRDGKLILAETIRGKRCSLK